MSDKYYTPEIEEFHVEFEYETLESIRDGSGNKTWNKLVMRNSPTEFKRLSDNAFGNGFDKEWIRVKYLDREDIESFNWKQGKLPYQLFDGIHMLVDLKDHKYSITHMADEQCLFYGTIKNKSEFKRILKQLGI